MDFETLYRRYAPDVYRFALFLCGRPDQADDIAAETFVRPWTPPEPMRAATVKAYLFTIARNLYRADARKNARHEVLADMVDRGASGEDASIARIDLDRVLGDLHERSQV